MRRLLVNTMLAVAVVWCFGVIPEIACSPNPAPAPTPMPTPHPALHRQPMTASGSMGGGWPAERRQLSVSAGDFFAAPSGTGTVCTQPQPCAAAFALGPLSPVKDGGMLWLRGGVYAGHFASVLTGATIASYPGEHAVIAHDGTSNVTLTISGARQRWQDIEIYNPKKATTASLNPPLALISVVGDSHRLIGMLIRDGSGIGIYAGESATNLWVIGNVIVANGIQPNLEHGIYAQNGDVGIKRIEYNIIAFNAGFGVHCYGSAGKVRGFSVLRNASIQNGAILGTRSRNFFFQSGVTMSNLDIENNYTYDIAGGTSTIQMEIDGPAGSSGVTVKGNTLVGPEPLQLNRFSGAVVTGNTFIPRTGWDAFIDATGIAGTFDGNAYSLGYTNDHNPSRWKWNGALQTLAQWKAATGFDATSTYAEPASGRPAANSVFVDAIPEIPGRGNVIVYNWQRLASVLVDLSAILSPGDTYEARYYQNPLGAPVASGTYSGVPVSLPMQTGLSVSAPMPFAGVVTPSFTAPEFGVFILKKGGSSSTPTPTPTPVPVTATATPPSPSPTPIPPSATWTATATSTATPTASFTATPTPTATPTSTSTATPTPSNTPTSTPTPTPTATPTPTNTPTMTSLEMQDMLRNHEQRLHLLELANTPPPPPIFVGADGKLHGIAVDMFGVRQVTFTPTPTRTPTRKRP